MAAVVADKYHLKSIHEEIGLFDRKLAHLMKFEKFDTEAERDQIARKLTLKRDSLARTAIRLAAEGVEFKRGDLPRSMRPNDESGALEIVQEIPEPAQSIDPPTASSGERRLSSVPYTGTSLDWQASVRQYMQKKAKA